MSAAVPFPNEIIAKLVEAGYLRPEHRHDADAITSAIANMKQDLRSGGNDKGPSVVRPTLSPLPAGLDRRRS